jgi:hypothetical protein
MIPTRNLAVYAAIVSTLSLAWTIAWSIFTGVLRDRARIKLKVYNSEVLDHNLQHIEDAISFSVRNRGRRPFHISDLAYASSLLRGTRAMSMVLQRQINADRTPIEEGQGRTYSLGGDGRHTFTHGDLPLTRWHVVDQAGRVYPLRERYRSRIERFVFWPTSKALDWWDKRHPE